LQQCVIYIVCFFVLFTSCNNAKKHAIEGLHGWEISDLHFPNPERDIIQKNKILAEVRVDTTVYYYDDEKKYRMIPDSFSKTLFSENGNFAISLNSSHRSRGGVAITRYDKYGLPLWFYGGGCMPYEEDYVHVWNREARIIYRIIIAKRLNYAEHVPDTSEYMLFDTNGRLTATLIQWELHTDEYAVVELFYYDSKGQLIRTLRDRMWAFTLSKIYSDDQYFRDKRFYYSESVLDSTCSREYCFQCSKEHIWTTYFDELKGPYISTFHDTASYFIYTITDSTVAEPYIEQYAALLQDFKQN